MRKFTAFVVLAGMLAFVAAKSLSNQTSMKMPENSEVISRSVSHDASSTVADSISQAAISQPTLRIQMPSSR